MNLPNLPRINVDIQQAARFAKHIHRNQKRKYSGVPYAFHLARVAGYTALLDDVQDFMIAAAWLHDSVEDQGHQCSFELIESLFGQDTASCVRYLTNTNHDPEMRRADRKQADRDRLSRVPWGILRIKLLDRYDNINDIPPSETKFATLYAQETHLLLDAIKPYRVCNSAEYETLHTMLRDRTIALEDAIKK